MASGRKKDPEAVRRRLLESAVALAAEHGMNGVTVQAVAAAAGVTKGGLFHHFPSKHALIEGLFADMIARLDAEIDACMAADPIPYGAFTRAYVETTLVGASFGLGTAWSGLFVSMTMEPPLRALWSDWMQGRLDRHAETDGAPLFEVIRFAADGAWLEHVTGGAMDARIVRDRLIRATVEGLAPPPQP